MPPPLQQALGHFHHPPKNLVQNLLAVTSHFISSSPSPGNHWSAFCLLPQFAIVHLVCFYLFSLSVTDTGLWTQCGKEPYLFCPPQQVHNSHLLKIIEKRVVPFPSHAITFCHFLMSSLCIKFLFPLIEFILLAPFLDYFISSV